MSRARPPPVSGGIDGGCVFMGVCVGWGRWGWSGLERRGDGVGRTWVGVCRRVVHRQIRPGQLGWAARAAVAFLCARTSSLTRCRLFTRLCIAARRSAFLFSHTSG